MNKTTKILIIVILIFLGIIMLMNRCDNLSPFINKGGDRIVRDTVYVTKTIKGDTVIVKETEFVPVYVENEVNEDLKNEVDRLKNDNEKITYLLNKLKTRVYDTTYNIKDRGSLHIKDSVQGSLLGREWSFKFDDIDYDVPIITNTKYKYPKYSIFAGLDSGISTDFGIFEKPYIGVLVGFSNSKGYQFSLGYNTLKQVKFQLTKTIFVKYNK